MINKNFKRNEQNIKSQKKTGAIGNFLLIALMAFLCVFFLGCGEDPEPTSEEPTSSEVPVSQDAAFLVTTDDTFFTDGLRISSERGQYQTIPFRYPHVSGLKDTKVEDQVNARLFKAVYDAVTEIADLYEAGDELHMAMTVHSAFSDTLSVESKLMLLREAGGTFASISEKRVFSNLKLKTGELLTLYDLFTEDTTFMDLSYETTVTSSLEESKTAFSVLSDVMDDFSAKKDFDFYFTEKEAVIIPMPGAEVLISFLKSVKQVVIYKKYVSNESLYTGEYPKPDSIPTFTHRGNALCEKVDYDISHKKITDVSLYLDVFTDIPDGFYDTICAEFETRTKDRIDHSLPSYSIYNASFTVYRVSEGMTVPPGTMYYMAITEYVKTDSSESAFRNSHSAVLEALRNDSEDDLKTDNLYVPSVFKDDMSQVRKFYSTLYFDASGVQIGEE